MRILLCCLIMVLALAACNGGDDIMPTLVQLPTVYQTPVPTSTATPHETITPIPTFTPTATPTEFVAGPVQGPSNQLVMVAAPGQGIEPPIEINLPERWIQNNDSLLIKDVDGDVRLFPFTIYSGPVTDGTGVIILIWGFNNVMNSFAPQISLYADGLRLLYLAVVEQDCIVGTTEESAFTVGDLAATGTYFSVTKCSQSTDIRGWFAGLQQDGINFVFYMYTEPLDAMEGDASYQLRDIIDSVTFHVEDFLLTPQPEN